MTEHMHTYTCVGFTSRTHAYWCQANVLFPDSIIAEVYRLVGA